ncbi:response regulator [Saccharibacillus deserti]|uniref:response regulator n=1 Tax=Saccharibacillus deserti TaxID=1634444 RepID=UPI001557C2CF|nr:response regulator [Saccharibacillus deserti]
MAKIMIVDDAAFMRIVLKEMLNKLGHEVVAEAANGVEAFREYARVKPDIVTMDITMPEMDGITAVRKIKESDPDAQIIMCSAMGQQGMIVEAVHAGAIDFIVKPFQLERVEQALRKWVTVV